MAPDPTPSPETTPPTEPITVTVTTSVMGDQVGATAVKAAPASSGKSGADSPKVEPASMTTTGWRPTYYLRNLTAWRIGVKSKAAEDDFFILPPFGDRPVTEDVYMRFEFDKWQNENLIGSDKSSPPVTDTRDMALGCGILLGVGYLVLGAIFYGLRVDPDIQTLFWFVGVLVALIAGLILLSRWKPVRLWLESLQHTAAQIVRLTTIVVIVIGLPSLVALFFGDNLGPLIIPQFQVARAQPILLALILQWSLIIAASILPIIIYFLFDRQKLGSLRENFYRQILRLDPQMETLDDARQTYRPQVEEIYGPESGSGMRSLILGTNVPIVAATLAITVGWIIALPPIVPATSPFTISSLYLGLVPQLSAINFGFMGAYVFALNMLLRRYVRSDLSPKVYTHITIRIFVVAVTVWALSAMLTFGAEALGVTGSVVGAIYNGGVQLIHPATGADNKTSATEPTLPNTDVSGPLLLLLAFFVGFVPETGVTIIQKYLRSQAFLKNIIPSEQDSHPLDRLDGINIYYQARLLEEGIENIQNLAHSDLIELMLNTRIPMSILIDWVDQAILYLHLAELQPEDQAEQTEGPLSQLRKYGIRTATDLLKAYQAAQDRSKPAAPDRTGDAAANGPKPDADAVQKFLGILDEKPDAPVQRLQVLIDALNDDEWLNNIQYWHKSGAASNQMYTFDTIMDLRAARRTRTTITLTVPAIVG